MGRWGLGGTAGLPSATTGGGAAPPRLAASSANSAAAKDWTSACSLSAAGRFPLPAKIKRVSRAPGRRLSAVWPPPAWNGPRWSNQA